MSKIQKLNNRTLALGIKHLKKVDSDFKEILRDRNDQINSFKKIGGFEGLISLIVEQQLSVASAKAIFSRVKLVCGDFEASSFLKIKEEELKATGLSRQKVTYCRNVAEAVINKTLDFKKLEKMSDQEVVEMLVKIKGIGEWTAQCYLMACMKRLDAWPSSDLGLIVAIQKIKKINERPKSLTIEKMAEPWKPYRSIAALLLWSTYDKD
ncbi:DNA-3-methyladenine glycosylase 2 family protein [Gammaproteobacteria bacterium]|nr:DNA-3-methyladenine glycosylase 2 family protein [Gammaproteobacteria bacterium]